MIHGYEATLTERVEQSGHALDGLGFDVAWGLMFYGHMRWALDLVNSPEEIVAFAQAGVFIPAGTRPTSCKDEIAERG